ncbi:MAG: glycoside hydrolase family 88 protein [Crocosphaera sp.]|nr:glycoside hydrolase family 88 protein [Crocosphaera sp.]
MNLNLAWFNSIDNINRDCLLHPLEIVLDRARETDYQSLSLKSLKRSIKTLLTKQKKIGNIEKKKYDWPISLSILGAEWSYRTFGDPKNLKALKFIFDNNIDDQGNWMTPINKVDYTMKGYSLLYLLELTNDLRYHKACQKLASSLLVEHERVIDGCLPYTLTGSAQGILVDTLAMICPFLARYSNYYGDAEAMNVSINQLKQFVQKNTDYDTHLPYHGYYDDGPKRLGMHAWGRGTSWYMIGLIDTLLEMPFKHPDYSELLKAYIDAANSLRNYQRQDGHWNWAILNRKDRFDSSTTSMVGYSLMRGLQAKLLDNSFQRVVDAAIEALVSVTRSNGVLEGSSGECQGLGKYPQSYGTSLWLQGSATAFAAIYFASEGQKQ